MNIFGKEGLGSRLFSLVYDSWSSAALLRGSVRARRQKHSEDDAGDMETYIQVKSALSRLHVY